MSNRYKFQTPASYRDELLRSTLIEDAINSKKFYEDGFYKPETEQQRLAKEQSRFYNRIDQIGYRISTQLYRDETGEGQFYRDETKRLTQSIAQDIEQSFKQGLMSPQTYDDLIGYMSEVIASAQSGDFTKRKAKTVGQQMEAPAGIVENLVAMNLSGLTNRKIADVLRELGATREQIRDLLELMQQQMAQAPTATVGNPGGDVPPTTALGLMQRLQGQTSDQGANISQPLVNSREGETNQTIDPFVTGDRSTMQQTQANINDGVDVGGSAGRARTEAEIDRRLIESADGLTDRYGLPQRVYDEVMADLGNRMSQDLANGVTPETFTNRLTRLAQSLSQSHNRFIPDRFVRIWGNVYERQFTQGTNEAVAGAGASSSAQALSGQQMADLVRAEEALDSSLNDRAPLPRNGNQAQRDAGMSALAPNAQLAQMINSQQDDIVKKIYNNINDNELPVDKAINIDNLREELNAQIDNLREVDGDMVANIQPTDDQLNQLRALPTPLMLRAMIEKMEMLPIEDTSVFKGIVNSFNKNAPNYQTMVSKLARDMGQLRIKTIAPLRDAMKRLDTDSRSYSLAWGLRLEIAGTDEDPESISRKYMSQIDGNPSMTSTDMSRQAVGLNDPKNPAVHPLTAVKNIINRIGKPREQEGITISKARELLTKLHTNVAQHPERYHLDDPAELQLALEGISEAQIRIGKKGFKPTPKKGKKGGARWDAKEYYKVGAPAQTAEIPDPPMRFTVGEGRKENTKGLHNIIMV